jgi:hypothetical protein
MWTLRQACVTSVAWWASWLAIAQGQIWIAMLLGPLAVWLIATTGKSRQQKGSREEQQETPGPPDQTADED